MSLRLPPISIPAKRELNRGPLDSEAKPHFVLTAGRDRAEKHFTIRKKTGTGHPRRPVASIPSRWRTAKTSDPQKLSAKGLWLRHTL